MLVHSQVPFDAARFLELLDKIGVLKNAYTRPIFDVNEFGDSTIQVWVEI